MNYLSFEISEENGSLDDSYDLLVGEAQSEQQAEGLLVEA